MTNNKQVDQLDNLLEALTEDALKMSREEILSEATSDFGSADKEVNRVRSIIQRAVLSEGDNDLKTVRKFYGDLSGRTLKNSYDIGRPLKISGKSMENNFLIAAKGQKSEVGSGFKKGTKKNK